MERCVGESGGAQLAVGCQDRSLTCTRRCMASNQRGRRRRKKKKKTWSARDLGGRGGMTWVGRSLVGWPPMLSLLALSLSLFRCLWSPKIILR